jgi:hypothetical protein
VLAGAGGVRPGRAGAGWGQQGQQQQQQQPVALGKAVRRWR